MEHRNTSIGAKLMSIALIGMGIFLGFYAFFANANNWENGIYQTQSWTMQISGDYYESPYETIATDDSDNIYIAGKFMSGILFGNTGFTSSGSYDMFIAKMDKDRNPIRIQKAGGTGNDGIYNISLDNSGNIYFIGTFQNTADFGSTSLISSGGFDVFVAKIDSSGNWLRAKKAGGTNWDMGYSLSLDMFGNIYLAGYFQNTADFGSTSLISSGGNDMFITKLNSTGDWLRAKKAGGVSDDIGYSLSLDTFGNIYLAGYFSATADFGSTSLISSGSNDIFISKLNSTGDWLRAKKAGGVGTDTSVSLSLDTFGNIYLVGYFSNTGDFGSTSLISSGDTDIFISKLDSSGNWLRAKKAGGVGSDMGMGTTTNISGDLFIIGSFSNTINFGSTSFTSNGSNDIFINKFVFNTISPVFTGTTQGGFNIISGGYYNTGITITYFDANISGATLDGTIYTGGTLITTDGTHIFFVENTIGNSTGITFTIDKINPILVGVTSSGYYNTGIIITGNDNTIFSGFQLSGTFYTGSSLTITGEGFRSLTGYDKAGNTTHINFVIDKTNPTTTGVINNTHHNHTIVITGSDFSFSGFQLSGTFYTGSSLTITGEGFRSLTGYDKAGNTTHINFTIDKTVPTFIGTTLSGTNMTSGGYYNTGVSITFSDLYISGATLSGAIYISGQLITGEGLYTFLVKDYAGNSTGTTFIIDTTNPVITTSYPTSGLNISGGNIITFLRSGTDTNISGYTLYITGTQTQTINTTSTSSTVTLMKGNYSRYVLATDRAGNTTASTILPFMITTPLTGTITITGTNIVYNVNPYTNGYVAIYIKPNQPANYIITGDISLGTIVGSTTGTIVNTYLSGADGAKNIYVTLSNSGEVVTGIITAYLDTTASTPILTSPISGTLLTTASSLLWQAVGADPGNVGLSGYKYFIATTGTLGVGVIKSGFTTSLTTGFTTNELGTSGTFYWYVQAIDKLGNSGTSAIRPFYYSGTSDIIPDSFSFTHITSATIDHIYGSNTVTITGLSANTPVLASITAGALYISGNIVGTTGYIQNGWTVKIELNSSDEYDHDITSTLTIGGVSAIFRITTETETEANNGTDYSDITTTLSSTERLQIIGIFEVLRDLYVGDKEIEFFSSLMVMIQSKIDDLGTSTSDENQREALQYLYDLADQYGNGGNGTSTTDIGNTSRIVNGVYTAPNGKRYTITYDSIKKFTSTNFVTPKYYPTLDVLKYDIDRNNPVGSSYLNAKTIKARWGRVSLDGTRQTSAYTAPNHKVFYFFKTTEGQYSSYTFTAERYFDSLEATKEFIYNSNR